MTKPIYTENLLKHLNFIAETLNDKINSKTLGKKFKGKAIFEINIYEGGITDTACQINEKINNK